MHVAPDYWYEDSDDAFGGMGPFSSPEELVKVLLSLLIDDGKLLRSETVVLFFESQLDGVAQRAVETVFEIPIMNRFMGALMAVELKKNWAFGGLLLMEDLPPSVGERAASSPGVGCRTWFGYMQ